MQEKERQSAAADGRIEGRERGQQDLLLVRAAAGGSISAIETLVVRLQCIPRMLHAENAHAGLVLGAHDLADTVQDAMLVAWSKLPAFTGTGPLEAWVHRICKLEFSAARRRRRRLATQSSDLFEDVTADAAADSSRSDRVAAALKLLGGVDAELVRQRLWQDLEFTTIAQRCGASVAAVKARFYRALRRLQQLCALLERLDAP